MLSRLVPFSQLVVAALLATILAVPPACARDDAPPAEATDLAAEEEQADEAVVQEEPEPEPVHPLVDEADSLIKRLKRLTKETDEDVVLLEDAGGEDYRVLLRQVWLQREAGLATIYALCDNVLEQESAALDTARMYRAVAETELAGLSYPIRYHIEDKAKQESRIRVQRESAKPEELVSLDERIAKVRGRVDFLYGVLADYSDRLAQMGLEYESERGYLVEQLERRARDLSGRVEVLREQVTSLETRLAEAPDDNALKLQLTGARGRLTGITESLRLNVQMMKAVDLDTAEYSRLLIQATGQVTADVLDTDVALGLASDALKRLKAWFFLYGPNWIFNVLVFVLFVIGSRIAARFARRITERAMSSGRVKVSRLLKTMTVALVGYSVMMLGVLIGLSQLGVQLGPLLTGLGIAGFIVGFALQDTLGNFAAGVMILGYRPYDEGDLVEAAGVYGKVNSMSLVTTTILTFDNQMMVVPNAKIWGAVIRNVTAQNTRRVDLEFLISYDDDVDEAEKIFNEIVAEHELTLDVPEPTIKVHKLDEYGIRFVVRPWARTANYWDVYWDVTRAVKRRFDAAGISIPVPRREIKMLTDKA